MPTLSASDYTTYLKLKAAANSPIRPAIQTRTNATLSQSVLNANLLTSQAAFVTTPSTVVPVVQTAVVTNASTTTVTAARTDIISSVTGSGALLTYTTSQAHGLCTCTVVTITGLTQNTLSITPNQVSQEIAVTSPTTFTITVGGSQSGASSGTGSFPGRVYYTTSVANGLVAGDVVSITGITTFLASGRTVLTSPTPTTFVLSSATTGTAVSGQSGSITGFVYYTTNVAHGLAAPTQNVSVGGLARYNLSLATVVRTPSATVFVVQDTATGVAVTGATGVLTVTFFGNTAVSITGLNYVRAPPQNRVNNPRAFSTIATGTLSSSRVQQPGGLPTGFKNSQGSYHRIPQQAGWGT